jgi:hypothetical protein
MSGTKELLKGELFHREKATKYLYALDEEIGVTYCFKKKVNQIRSKVIILSGSELLDYPSMKYLDYTIINNLQYLSFDFVVNNQTYAIIVAESQDIENLREKFRACFLLPVPIKYRTCCSLFRGVGFMISIPFEISNVLCKGLETVSDKVGGAPERVFKVPVKENKRFIPGNVASGLLMGTGKMLIGVVKGIGGLVYEPIKGAKESGFKGATKGIGKGILGLVCKPVAGTIEFVTLTVRGVNNTPSAFYKSAVKIYKKNKEKKEKARQSLNLSCLEDCAPKSYEINLQSPIEEDKISDNNEDINIDQVEIIDTHELIVPILERNFKLREWILELSNFLNKEEELIYEELDEDDVIEFRVQEAKHLGEKLKKKIVNLIEELHYLRNKTENMNESYADFNSRMVANLKELGITVKDEFVLDLANLIEEDLLGDEEPPKLEEVSYKVEPEAEVNIYIEKAKEWKPYTQKDNYRIPEAGSKGGISLTDSKVQSVIRNVGKEIIKSMGKKVLSGDFNLTTMSFPIKCMMPCTSLHNILKSMCLGPLYFTKASLIENPVERIKLIAIGTIGTFRNTATFLKPVYAM